MYNFPVCLMEVSVDTIMPAFVILMIGCFTLHEYNCNTFSHFQVLFIFEMVQLTNTKVLYFLFMALFACVIISAFFRENTLTEKKNSKSSPS